MASSPKLRFTVAKKYTFDAAHQLFGLEEGHKCGNLHGHTYTVEVEVSSLSVDKVGMVWDYRNLDELLKPIIELFDHRNLNDVFAQERFLDPSTNEPANTTAENIALLVFFLVSDMLEDVNAPEERQPDKPEPEQMNPLVLERVTVCETPKTSSTVRWA